MEITFKDMHYLYEEAKQITALN